MNSNHYDSTTPIKPELVKAGIIKPINDDQKQSKLTKSACTALGFPIDSWNLLDDSASTPVEVLNDWHSIDDALDKLKADVSQIIDNGKNLSAITGTLVD